VSRSLILLYFSQDEHEIYAHLVLDAYKVLTFILKGSKVTVCVAIRHIGTRALPAESRKRRIGTLIKKKMSVKKKELIIQFLLIKVLWRWQNMEEIERNANIAEIILIVALIAIGVYCIIHFLNKVIYS